MVGIGRRARRYGLRLPLCFLLLARLGGLLLGCEQLLQRLLGRRIGLAGDRQIALGLEGGHRLPGGLVVDAVDLQRLADAVLVAQLDEAGLNGSQRTALLERGRVLDGMAFGRCAQIGGDLCFGRTRFEVVGQVFAMGDAARPLFQREGSMGLECIKRGPVRHASGGQAAPELEVLNRRPGAVAIVAVGLDRLALGIAGVQQAQVLLQGEHGCSLGTRLQLLHRRHRRQADRFGSLSWRQGVAIQHVPRPAWRVPRGHRWRLHAFGVRNIAPWLVGIERLPCIQCGLGRSEQLGVAYHAGQAEWALEGGNGLIGIAVGAAAVAIDYERLAAGVAYTEGVEVFLEGLDN